tara:strand:- start:2340 stop:2732 length:393 start_codon:yes stop_codon:yes gene_type:complete
MAKSKNKFPIIVKQETFTRVNDSIVVQIKDGLWRYRRDDAKIEFSSRLGAVSYAVAYETGNSTESIKRIDNSLGKHKNDAMFHKHHLKEAHKRNDKDAILLYQTRLDLSIVGWDQALKELKELSKAMNIV